MWLGEQVFDVAEAEREPEVRPRADAARTADHARAVAKRMQKISYAGYRFPPEVIHQAIWLAGAVTTPPIEVMQVEPKFCIGR